MGVHGCAPTRTLSALSLFAIAVTASTAAAERVVLEDRVAQMRFDYLAARSATMKQLLAIVEMTPGILVRVRARHGLRDSMRAGHGKLQVNADGIQAILEVDTTSSRPLQQMEIVAHEVAHVVEVVCLAAAPGDLQRVLLQRGFGIRQQWGRIGIETPFAVDVGRSVVVEALKGGTHPGQLHKLAGQHELGAPCLGRPIAFAGH